MGKKIKKEAKEVSQEPEEIEESLIIAQKKANEKKVKKH
jgi:hypothetical protein